MAFIHIERGRISKVTMQPEIIDCLWENWDIFDALLDKKWNIQKVREGVWRGGRKFKAEVELVEVRRHSKSGIFKYQFRAVGPWGSWFPASGTMTLRYSATPDGKASAMSTGEIEARGFAVLGMRIYEKVAHRLADEFINDGERAATMISKNLQKSKQKLSRKQQEILEEYLTKEEISQKRGVGESRLHIVPLDSKSLIRFETSLPKTRKIRGKMKTGRKVGELIDRLDKLVNCAITFSSLSRSATKLENEEHLTEIGEEFYEEAMNLGQQLYSAYIPDRIHGHLTAMLDYSSDIRFNLCAEGRDAGVPWEILYDGEDFLSLKTNLVRAWTEIVKIREKLVLEKVLIVGSNPRNDLQYVDKEVEAVSQVLSKLEGIRKVRSLFGENATKDNVIKEMTAGDYQILHYVGHSEYNKENPKLSFLLLNNEKKLRVDDLTRLSKDSALQLVFLNACASGAATSSEISTVGLANSFVDSGIPYVIGMLWPVSDLEAQVLATEFYSALLALRDPVAAIRRARQRIIDKFGWTDPVWAAPIIYG